jgi:hypothetical protein
MLALHRPGEAPLMPPGAAEAAQVRMIDRVFDNYVMGNMQRVVNAYVNIGDRENPDPGELAAAREGLLRAALLALRHQLAMPPEDPFILELRWLCEALPKPRDAPSLAP